MQDIVGNDDNSVKMIFPGLLSALADEITYQICVPATRVLYFCIRRPDARLLSVYDIRGDDRGILDEDDVCSRDCHFCDLPIIQVHV